MRPAPFRLCAWLLAGLLPVFDVGSAQAADSRDPESRERWFIEGGLGFRTLVADPYEERLRQFGFENHSGELTIPTRRLYQLAVGALIRPFFGVVARYEGAGLVGYERDLPGERGQLRHEAFSWSSRSAMIGARGRLPGLSGRLAGYAEIDVGIGFGATHFASDRADRDQHFRGSVFALRVGVEAHPTPRLGGFIEVGYAFLPVIRNLLDEVHNDGGVMLCVGARLRTLGRGL